MRRVTTENQEYLKAWISRVLNSKFPEDLVCIGQEIDGKIQAVVGYCGFSENHCYMHCASLTPRWISKDLLWACFDYPFNKLGLRVILATVSSNNEEALKLDRHLGFVDKAYIEDAHKDGDLVILTMRKEECKWLHLDTPLKKVKEG